MATALGIINNGLDEVLRRELRNYRPKNIIVNVVSSDGLLPGPRVYFVLTEIKGMKSRRRFISTYRGDNPEGFLEIQKIRLDEMFACPIETYLDRGLYD